MTTDTTAKEVPKMKRSALDLTPLLNQEILRVAKEEKLTDDTSMKTFMSELADLCGVSLRMVYHWRSGHAKLPGDHVPSLCKRLGSLVLLDALKSAAAETQIEIPDQFDLALQASRAVRQDLECYERVMLSFEDGVIEPGELIEMKELEARAHRNLHLMIGIAEAACERHLVQDAPQRKANRKADSKVQIPESRKQVAR
jgi:hypothetical protein